MPGKNIEYKSKQISSFYSCNRHRWSELYPSEKYVFKKIAGKNRRMGNVLDVGCACGGLGAALSERFILNSYTGVDINRDAISWARKECKLRLPATFIAGDIIRQRLDRDYDTVVSLSCADWNVETNRIIETCWKRVKYGGYFVVSLRLTLAKGVNNIRKSYQYINFSGDEEKPEIANYVVFNCREALKMMKKLSPSPALIGGYGYWGRPSATAVTPFEKVVFAVFYIKKQSAGSNRDIQTKFRLPIEPFL